MLKTWFKGFGCGLDVLEPEICLLIRCPTQTLNQPLFKPGSTAICVDFGLLLWSPESHPTADGGGLHGDVQPTMLAFLLCPWVSLSLALFAGGWRFEGKSARTGRLFSGRCLFVLSLSLNLSCSISWVGCQGGHEECTHLRDFLGRRRGFSPFWSLFPFFGFVACLMQLILLAQSHAS